ncbi:MAG: hypothetical protein ABSA52_04065 [Candidatus Binatia bacterium]|jgi:hypothetical protein
MKWLRSPISLLCVVCLSCASGGGPSGTGISSTSAISGNVVAVQDVTAGAASDGTSGTLPPIVVSIDGLPTATTMADSGGNFMLSGNFPATLTLRFTVPQFQVTQQLDVPAGSAVILQDIDLQPSGIVAQAARQLNFFGTVDPPVDCTDGTLLVRDQRSNGMQFLVHLNDQTSYVDAAGAAQSCTAISVGTTVIVEGSIANSEGSIANSTNWTITAAVVTITTQAPAPPGQQLETQFSGALVALDCTAGFVVVDNSVEQTTVPAERTTVQLTAETRLTGATGALTCQDLQLGDPVSGQGQIELAMPGVIVATQLVVISPPTGQSLRVRGFVTTTDCATGALQLQDDGTTIDVQLSAATAIIGGNGQPLTCADIQAGDRVEGLGQVAPDGSTIDAVRITITGPWLRNAMRP